MTPGSAAVFSAREVIAAGEAFRLWGREFHDAGVALDEIMSLEPREPTVLRVAVGAARPKRGLWMSVAGDWLFEPGKAPRRLPRPAWSYDTGARDWSSAREWLEAWEVCDDARWMLHAAASVAVDRRLVVLAACACARTSLRHVPEGEARPLRAIETAEAWARGEATAGQARAAADAAHAAAYDAYDDADAAAYAAYAACARSAAYVAASAAYGNAAYAAYAAYAAGHPVEAARRDALRELASLVRSSIPTLDVLRAASATRRPTP